MENFSKIDEKGEGEGGEEESRLTSQWRTESMEDLVDILSEEKWKRARGTENPTSKFSLVFHFSANNGKPSVGNVVCFSRLWSV